MIDDINIFFGDCLELLGDVKDKSVNLICTDLPYECTKNEWDKTIDIQKLWPHYERVLVDDGCIVLFGKKPGQQVI